MEHKHNNNQSTPKNNNLHSAKRAKNDEFYTQWADIEKEMNAYVEHDPDVFRDKTVLLPCDDPEWSNFTKYFALNFETFGIKKLISTSYAQTVDNPRGKKLVLTREDINRDDSQWEYLEGDGDFRSEEVTALRDEADFVITNPPFSLFPDFMAWLIAGGVKFAVMGNMNAITYKKVFPLIKENRVWLGPSTTSGNPEFRIPESIVDLAKFTGEVREGIYYQKVMGVRWFTNIEHGRRNEPLKLMTEAENIKNSKHKKVKGIGYQKYDNYNAIEVPFVDAIPSDYDGIMGVPISFLDKYCPDQFEILGSFNNGEQGIEIGAEEQEILHQGKKLKCNGPLIDGKRLYKRIIIRRKDDQSED